MTNREARAKAQYLFTMANCADSIYGSASPAGKAFREMAQDILDKIAANYPCSCPFPGGVPEKAVNCPVHGN